MTDAEIAALAERIQDRIIERVEQVQEEWLFEAVMAQPHVHRARLAEALGVEL